MSNRGDRRLAIARRLLGIPAQADVLSLIKAKSEAEQERIRGLVDWVEDYEDAEDSLGTGCVVR